MLKSLGFCLALSCSALVTAAPPTVESVEALLSASKVEKIIDATEKFFLILIAGFTVAAMFQEVMLLSRIVK